MADGVIHLPPSDPSTGAKQDTGNGSLSSILTKLTDTLARFGVLGADGSGIASVSNAVPIGGVDTGGTARTALTNASGVLQSGIAKGTSYSSAALEASAVVSASAGACVVTAPTVTTLIDSIGVAAVPSVTNATNDVEFSVTGKLATSIDWAISSVHVHLFSV
jgi:hypothetical protein